MTKRHRLHSEQGRLRYEGCPRRGGWRRRLARSSSSRSTPRAGIDEGQEAELWLDPSRMHLFDPESGDNLTHGRGVDARTLAPADRA